MGKKYIGEFTSRDHKDYRIEIETATGSGTQNVSLGAIPFKTEMSSTDSNIYTNIKGTTATIQLICEDYLFDIYSPSATGTKVSLIETTDGINEIRWVGFVTPLLYNQGFKLVREIIEVEAIDGLSALEDVKFVSDRKQVMPFLKIITKILIRHLSPRYLYVSDNVQLTSPNSTETILDKLYVSEMNFFDEKSEPSTLDDDVCWNCLDVISEICKYLGYTAIMDGQDVWLIDYDSIKKGNASYWRYDLRRYMYVESNTETGWVNPDPIYELTTSPERITFTHTHKIVGEDHKSTDASVSLDEVYNKITVKADTYSVSDLTANDALNENITRIDNGNFTSSGALWNKNVALWAEVFPADDNPGRAMDCWIDVHNDAGANCGGKHNYYDFTAMKFFKNPNSKFFIYDKNWNDISDQYQDEMSYPVLNSNNGAAIVKYFSKNIDKCKTSKTSYVDTQWSNWYKEIKNNPNADSGQYLDYCLERSGIRSISWTDAIILTNLNAQSRPNQSEWYKYPYYQTSLEGSVVVGGENKALIIEGQFYWHNIGSTSSIDAYPMEYDDFKLDKKNWIFPSEDCFVPASIEWGNLWWNGENWQTSRCGFKLNWLSDTVRKDDEIKGKKETIEEMKCQKTIMQNQQITNTVTWRFGTTEQGCLITLPEDQNLTGKPILTIYRPVSARVWKSRKDYYNGDNNNNLAGDYSNKNGVRWPWFLVALIGLKFKVINGDPSYSGEANKSDTVYTNYLDNDSIKEMSTINFKVHTDDGKDTSFGSVYLSDGSQFADKLYNKALYDGEKTWRNFNDELAVNGMRQEEHLIYKLCNQYETPSKILECELKIDTVKFNGLYTDTTLSDYYIPMKISTDYKSGSQVIKLIEKK